MNIHFLGHSEFILEIPAGGGKKTALLCDSWLTDYAFGDFMARNPELKINREAFAKIDGIFISHPHCDHLDPYTLIPLFEFHRPDIILPESMLYLKDIFNRYLNNPNIIILEHNREIRWKGITLTAFSFPGMYLSNEDDVMPLMIESEDTMLFHEIDCAVPESAEAWDLIHKKFKKKKFINRIYLATRNELEALFLSYDAKSPEARKKAMSHYREKRRYEMDWEYEKYDSGEADFPEIWKLPGMIKIFTGQGMIHSPDLFPEHLKISNPFPLDFLLKEETKTARRHGRRLNFAVHRPGMSIQIQNGEVVRTEKSSYVESVKFHETSYDENTVVPENKFHSPVFDERRDTRKQTEMIENIINNRFYPYQIINPENSLKSIIHTKKNKHYVIEILLGTSESFNSVYYALGLSDFKFRTCESAPDAIDESYWANDLEDFILGRQDMFSTTLHNFKENTTILLWTALGMPYLNSDIVHNKIEFHFKRASENRDANGWFSEATKKFRNDGDRRQ